MPMQYRIDVFPVLKAKGFNTNKLRQDKLLNESTIQKLRTGTGVSWGNLETICQLFDCQPGDILKYVREDKE